ncbi:hypothetical protein [Methylobacterium sp. Leaf466]|uniref:hypothetical protein n=1 Tax=Methylobacterium sp. Leaf466 TaxID=1736386 RepID=UPI0012E335DF|nr:hypothetical protein [Methylobacterium sp. Leaf466]
MNTLDPNILIDISTKIAGIDERTKSLQAADISAQTNADHRHRNVMQAMETFVPRREMEHMLSRVTEHCDTNRNILSSRVEVVEKAIETIKDNGVWIKRTVIGAGITALIALGAYLWKIVFVLKLVS